MTTQEIEKIKREFSTQLEAATTADQLRDLEIAYLGRKQGKLTNLLRGLKDVSVEDRKTMGPQLQALKQDIEKAIAAQITNYQLPITNALDVTLPGVRLPMGHYSPLTTMRRSVEEVFRSMGFMVFDGPELESEYFNFDALNIPQWHPAREMWDTFYVQDTGHKIPNYKLQITNDSVIASNASHRHSGIPPEAGQSRLTEDKQNRLLLRTHTSAMQVRIMRQFPLPLRAIVPGTVYRNEATDARHEKAFMNVEGLMVGEGISLQNLISISRLFLNKVLAEDVEVRFRPGYFPFTEPSLELDISCLICKQKGCAVCKKTGWLEFMGAGMVHPNVLKAGGIDSKKYTGFAFGFGLDRLVMLKYGIDDVRLFRSQDLRFLHQF